MVLSRRRDALPIKAVLVGVDVYERSDVPRLSGCVNDVALVRRILKEYLDVPNDDIRVVVNERATKANIMHRLRAMIDHSEAGDALVFFFSGHGSQIRDRSGDELNDFLDEVICPYDMDWDRGTYILDDDLDALFAELPEDVLLEAFFDCCFWGVEGVDRELLPPVSSPMTNVRYLPPPLDIAARIEGDESRLAYHALSGCNCFIGRNVMWAASQEGQPSCEGLFEGQVHGVFTYWGCNFIESSFQNGSVPSREELVEELREYVRQLGYAQLAQLSAPGELREMAPLVPPALWAAWASEAPGDATASDLEWWN